MYIMMSSTLLYILSETKRIETSAAHNRKQFDYNNAGLRNAHSRYKEDVSGDALQKCEAIPHSARFLCLCVCVFGLRLAL